MKSFFHLFDRLSWTYAWLDTFRQISPIVQSHLKRVYLTLSCALGASVVGSYLQLSTNIRCILTVWGGIAGIIWFFCTPPHQERKRFGILMGMALVQGASGGSLINRPFDLDPSILVTAFVGTSIVLGCFTAAAIVAKRREYFYLGGLLSSGIAILMWFRFAYLIFGQSATMFDLEPYAKSYIYSNLIGMKAASSAALSLNPSSSSLLSFRHRAISVGSCRATTRRLVSIRKAILSSAMSSEASTSTPADAQVADRMGDGLGSVKQQLSRLFESSLTAAFPNENMGPIIAISTQKSADYQCNNAMGLFSKIKGKSAEYKRPDAIGQAIIRNLPASDMIKSTSVAGPGFVNIVLSDNWVSQYIQRILLNGIDCWAPLLPVKRAVVDFSSPNIAKEMHVGHLRSTIIGDTLARMLEFSKVDVLRRNHVGDWGTQFGMLIEFLFEMFPNWEDAAEQAIGDLQEFYKASKKRFDEDSSFKERAQLAVVQLQGGDANYHNAWEKICEISRKEFNAVYMRLGVSLEEKGESFYNPYIPAVLEELTNKGLVEESQGARVIFIEGQQIPLIVVKRDGGFNYASTDLAALWYRLNVEKAEWIIYVTDSGQQQHFSMVFSAAQLAGWLPKASDLYPKASHVGFGLVLGSDGKRFRTRSSEVVRLADLLDEAKARCKDELMTRLKDNGKLAEWTDKELEETAEALGYGAVKYADLKNNRLTNYTFSFEQMLNDKGNTAVYLLYTHARICSIIRKSGRDIEELIKSGTITLGHADERILGRHLIHFAETVEEAITNLLPNVICEYLYNLSEIFTRFYTNCKVVGSEEETSRLLLCEATSVVMRKCFHFLGITPVYRI